MANTYTQILLHVVFAVRNRLCIIHDAWKNELYKYITGIIKNNNHKPLIINGVSDHIHILFGLRPSQSISSLMQDIKGCSSKWVNERGFVNGRFSWQEGYGAFSYTKSHLTQVVNYIIDQENQHKKKAFLEEYIELLEEFGINYDEKYIFKPVY